MRGAVILLPLLLLAGCKDEPDFEARYDKAAEEIEARAKAMDADIAESEAAAAAAGDDGRHRSQSGTGRKNSARVARTLARNRQPD